MSETGSTRQLRMRERSSAITARCSPRSASTPPTTLVPPPNGTTATPAEAHASRTAATSPALAGSTTASGAASMASGARPELGRGSSCRLSAGGGPRSPVQHRVGARRRPAPSAESPAHRAGRCSRARPGRPAPRAPARREASPSRHPPARFACPAHPSPTTSSGPPEPVSLTPWIPRPAPARCPRTLRPGAGGSRRATSVRPGETGREASPRDVRLTLVSSGPVGSSLISSPPG